MNPRGTLFVLGGLGIVFLAYLFLLPKKRSNEVPEKAPLPEYEPELELVEPPASDDNRETNFSFFEEGDVVEDAKKPRLLRHYGRDDRSGADDLRLVQGVLKQFWRMTKDPDQLMLGTNEDVLKQLTGANSLEVEFVSPKNGYLDTNGRLLDRWGTPLFFHANSVTDIEVRSSGPDLERFTDDDIVMRATSPIRPKL